MGRGNVLRVKRDLQRRQAMRFVWSDLFKSLGLAALVALVSWSGSSQAEEAKTYPVGAVLEKSGALENWGRQSEWGMNLALEELNGKDGVTIELTVEDNKSTPDQSANAFISLVEVKKVVAVLGSVASSHTRAMKEQANKLKVPLVTHASTNVQLTKDSDWL